MRTISRYSGKCDFADILAIYGEDRILSDYKVFHSGDDRSNNRIDFCENRRLLIPWYPYIVGAMASSPEGGTIYLSRYPFPYQEEIEYWDRTKHMFKNKLRYQKSKCRKLGAELDVDSFIDNFIDQRTMFHRDDRQLREFCWKIVNKEETGYPLRGMSRWYMTTLCQEMISEGLDPTDYGYILQDGMVVDYVPHSKQ